MNRLLSLLVALAVVFTGQLALAQGNKSAGDKRAKVEARMKQLRGRVLRSQVGLDEKKAAEVEKILAKHAPRRLELRKEMQTHRRQLRELVKKDSNDQAAYQKAIQGLRAVQKKLHAQREKELDELAKVLTPKQQAKLLIAVRRLENQVRTRLRERKDRD